MIILRNLTNKVIKSINDDEIVVILGTRQVGKTSLMKDVQLKVKGKALFLDMEDIEMIEMADKTSEFIQYLETERGKRNKLYVFIDEVQHLSNPSNLLKIIYDHHPFIKLVVSGSSSFDIRKKFKDSLAGRKKVFTLFPLSFNEFLRFKREKKLEDMYNNLSIEDVCKKGGIPSVYNRKFISLFEEFVQYGGYPKPALTEDREEKIQQLKEIYTSYIEKDIKDFLKIENVPKFNKLLRFLAVQSGGIVSFGDISGEVSIARETLEKYIFLLKNTFVINVLSPFYTNKQKEITKSPKIYFQDAGMRNFAIKDFRKLEMRQDKGRLIELVVLSEITKFLSLLQEVFYWRTQSKQELDFVLKYEDKIFPIEVKYQKFDAPRITTGVRSFMKKYNPPKVYIATREYWGKTKYNDTSMYFFPVYAVSRLLVNL